MKKTINVTIVLVIVLIIIFIFSFMYFTYHYNRFNRPSYLNEFYTDKLINTYIKNPKDHSTPYKNPLFQTYYDKSKIPGDIYENIKKFAPEYTHVILDDSEIISFMKYHFKDSVVETFLNLKNGAHKADLARYCILYIYGGLYMDIKVDLIKPLSDIFNKGDDVFYSVISNGHDHIHQGIIKTPSRNRLFLSLIDYIVTQKDPQEYIDFCRDLYVQLMNDIHVKEGFCIGSSGKKYYFFKEKCSRNPSMCYDGLDRHGYCCFVWDGETPVIKSRRSSFGKMW